MQNIISNQAAPGFSRRRGVIAKLGKGHSRPIGRRKEYARPTANPTSTRKKKSKRFLHFLVCLRAITSRNRYKGQQGQQAEVDRREATFHGNRAGHGGISRRRRNRTRNDQRAERLRAAHVVEFGLLVEAAYRVCKNVEFLKSGEISITKSNTKKFFCL